MLKHGVPQDLIDDSFIVMQEETEPFVLFSTEHRRIKKLKKKNFVAPEPVVVGEVRIPKSKGSKVTLLQSSIYGQYISLEKTLTNLFSQRFF